MKKPDAFKHKQGIITYLVFLAALILDQVSKQLIINSMPITIDMAAHTYSDYPGYEIFSWFWLKHVVNFGAAFSIFFGKTAPLIFFVSVIVTCLIVYERKTAQKRNALLSTSLGLILGGALGNLTDRIRLGYVTDFFALIKDGKYIWPIFNVADIAVNTGVGLFLLYILLYETKNTEETQATP